METAGDGFGKAKRVLALEEGTNSMEGQRPGALLEN
jgi:hypothetical protein